MWLVGEVSVGTMLGDEVFERVHNEVGVDAQYASPSCPSLVEAVGNQSIIILADEVLLPQGVRRLPK